MEKILSLKKLTASLLLIFFMILNLNFVAIADETAQSNATFISGQSNENVKIEHLPTYKKTEINTVAIYADKATIKKGNILKITFAEHFSTKTAKIGDKVRFILKEDLKTAENRILLPEGTQIIATVTDITPTKIWNRNVYLCINLKSLKLWRQTFVLHSN